MCTNQLHSRSGGTQSQHMHNQTFAARNAGCVQICRYTHAVISVQCAHLLLCPQVRLRQFTFPPTVDGSDSHILTSKCYHTTKSLQGFQHTVLETGWPHCAILIACLSLLLTKHVCVHKHVCMCTDMYVCTWLWDVYTCVFACVVSRLHVRSSERLL